MAGKDNTASDFCQASSLIHLCTDVNTQTNTNGADLPGGNNNLNSKFELNLYFRLNLPLILVNSKSMYLPDMGELLTVRYKMPHSPDPTILHSKFK
jgi:hypothetical protein